MNLSLAGIWAGYSGDPVLRGVDLEVAGGQTVGLLAPSGAGKSTLLRVASLQLDPTRGRVLLGGRSYAGEVPRTVRARLGIIPQEPRQSVDPRLSLGATMTAPLSFQRGSWRPRPSAHREEIESLTRRVGLDPELLRRRPDEASDGQLQRVLLARAVATGPDLLVCDEPTAALDRDAARTVLHVLAAEAARGAAVLIASHDRDLLLEAGARVLELDGGRLLSTS